MQASIFVMSANKKHYVSGTVYTPNGIIQYNGIHDKFKEIFYLFPTFATLIQCQYDVYCKRNNSDTIYYLTYRNEGELVKMLSFMVGESVEYLQYIPKEVIKKLDIHSNSDSFYIGGANIFQDFVCKLIGSIPTYLAVNYGYIIINGVKIGKRDESGDYDVCGKIISLCDGIINNLPYLLSCYYFKHYKGTPTWSEVLKAWCGIRISSMM